MGYDPMSARSLLTQIEFDKAIEVLEVLKTSNDADELADAMEEAAQGGEFTHALIFRLVYALRGWEQPTGQDVSAAQPTFKDLILPPGVNRD